MTNTETAPRKPFTAETLADYVRTGLTSEIHPRSWEGLCDLGYELADRSTLTVEQARRLVDLTAYGLPIVLTWETTIGNDYAPAGEPRRIETTTATVIVENLFPPANGWTGRVHVRYLGFGHSRTLGAVVDVAVPETTHTYRDA